MWCRLILTGALGAFVVGLAEPASARSHTDEIQALATVMAMAQTASDRCTDILVSNAMLDQAPAFFHLAPDDQTSYQFATQLEMKRLAAAIDAAPSLKAWCDAAFRSYGPDGDVMKG